MKLLKNRKSIIIVIFLFFLILGYLVPMVADDWFWGTYYGKWQISNLFREVNGRYLGNLLIVAISRNRILRMFIFSIILTITVYLLGSFKQRKNTNLLFAFVLLMTMSINMLKEGVLWISGFANYATSGLCLIILFYFIYHHDKINQPKSFVLFIFGIISSLFLENVTITMLLVSLILNIYYYSNEKKINKSYLLLFVGCLIGSIIMFSNPSYRSMIDGTYNQTQKALSFNDILSHLFDVILPELIYRNPVFLFFLTNILCNNISNQYRKLLLRIHPFISLCLTIYLIVFGYNRIIINAMSILSIMIIIEYLLFVFKKKDNYLSLLTISVILLCGPLLFVNPAVCRMVYPIHLVLIIILLYLMDEIKIKERNLYISVSVLMVIFLCIYSFIYYGERQRKYHILNNKEKEKIVIPYLPFNSLITNEEIDVREYQEKYLEFLNVNQNIEFEILDYFNWLKVR